MSELKGQPGELRATIHVTRAATGKVDTYELVGGCSEEQFQALTGKIHGSAGALTGQGSSFTNQTKE